MPSPPAPDIKPPLLVVVGPTAAGKTAFAIRLAQALGGEIISADSRYLYRGLDIGTAKPTADELAAAPHHLIDVTTPDRVWSLATYQAAALAAIADCHQRGVLPILAGGTGQYVRCIIEGWMIPPQPDTAALRQALELELARQGLATLAGWVGALDPQAVIDIHNPRRVVRALEVILSTGRPFSAQREKQPPDWNIVQLGLNRPRPELYARIDARVDAMLTNGLVAECQQLARLYDWSLPAMSSLGYKQMRGYFAGDYDLTEAVRLIKRETRRFVRRQANWFAPSDPAIRWLHPDEVELPALVAALRMELQV